MVLPSPRAALAGAALAAALALPGAAAAAPPTFQVADAGPAVAGLSTADQIAGELLAPGVSLAGAATINGTSDPAAYAAALPSFGRFTGGEDDLGLASGLIIGANARAGSFAAASYQPSIAADRDDAELYGVVNAAGLCAGGASACINNATSIEFAVVPTARYLKFEYALAVTEVGSWNGTAWNGDVFSYPDGFALFVGGRQVADNCAVLPRTSTYVTMQTAGVVAQAGSGTNRALAQANLDARVADAATPPVTPNGFAYAAQNAQWTVRFLTVPLTCVADVEAARAAGTPADVKIVVADANDSSVPPAVLLRGGSVRFSDNATPSPVADPPPAPPTPAPAPGSPPRAPQAPAAPAEVVTPLAPTAVTVPRGAAGRREVVMVSRLRFDAAGRYTFIYLDRATGRRIAQLPGSRIGARRLGGRASAPVLRTAAAGRRLVLATRLDRRTVRAATGGVALRVVHKAADGTLSEVTLGTGGVPR